MVGECMREVAVLLLVFIPLDAAFARVLTLGVVLVTLGLSAILLVIGILMEVKRL